MAGLLAVFAFHDRMGLTALAVLVEVLIASLALLVVGVVAIMRAGREGSGYVSGLIVATILAGAPLVLVAFAWLRSSVK